MIIRQLIAFTGCLALALFQSLESRAAETVVTNAHPALIPIPARVERHTGILPANQAAIGAIRFVHAAGVPAEGYDLEIAPAGAVVRSSTEAGAFYAAQTLKQLRAADGSLPCVTIHDEPRFSWRGMMLDAARHFQSKEYVERYLDLMAGFKLNVFHWHLVDDHGWRIEIKKYPKLTEVGAWRKQPGYTNNGGIYGGFYTQDDIREVVAYAAARHITMVPEIEMPGHSEAALAAYPELTCDGKPGFVGYFFDYPCKAQRFPASSCGVYCAGNEQTFAFLEDVLTEVMVLFPGKYIHVGGDEVDMGYWNRCAKCQARMKAEGLKDGRELEGYFMKRIETFLNIHGKKLIGWDEILEGGLAPNATVMSWRGVEGGRAAVKAGHHAVMSPQNALYFDHAQSASPDHPPSWPGVNSLETVYRYEPVPDGLAPEQEKLILGAQANLWTCFTHTPELLDLMTFPRECALAEIDWSPKVARDWKDFSARMEAYYSRLDALGVRYYRDASVIIGAWQPADLAGNGDHLDIDITDRLTKPCQFVVTMNYTHGKHGLKIESLVVLEDGREVSRDAHAGFSGWSKTKIIYTLDLPVKKPSASYIIRATVAGDGGTDSFGDIVLTPKGTT
jgi:hexosaminidase